MTKPLLLGLVYRIYNGSVIYYRIAGNFSEFETLTIFASRRENVKV